MLRKMSQSSYEDLVDRLDKLDEKLDKLFELSKIVYEEKVQRAGTTSERQDYRKGGQVSKDGPEKVYPEE